MQKGDTMVDTVAGFFTHIEEHIETSRLQGVNATLQFEISGDDGGDWCVTISEGSPQVTSGKCEAGDLTLLASDEDWLKITSGEMSVQMAFVTGRLKLRGDMTLAMKLQGLFRF
jgi:putative sterol carrier protein